MNLKDSTPAREERILIVVDTLPPDPNGVSLIALRTAEILARRASVTLMGPTSAEVPAGVTYLRMRRSPLGNKDVRLPWPDFRAIRNAVASSTRVVVHTPGFVGSVALLHAKRLGKPTTLFLHNDYRSLLRYNLPKLPILPRLAFLGGLLEKWAVGSSDRVLSATSNSRFGKAENLRLRPPLFSENPQPIQRDSRPTVVYHGRVSAEKAVDVTVKAIASAKREAGSLNFRIVGGGIMLGSILAYAQRVGVCVEHIPWCAEPRTYLNTAQMYVTATREETFSISTLEAMGCGLPVIARAVGAIPNYIRDGENGLLFVRDEELSLLIARLSCDPHLRLRLAEGARASAADESIWDQFARASIGAEP